MSIDVRHIGPSRDTIMMKLQVRVEALERRLAILESAAIDTEQNDGDGHTVPKWVDLPDGHTFDVGDKFLYSAKTYEVSRAFTKEAEDTPPVRTDVCRRIA